MDFLYIVSEIPNSRDDTHTPANGNHEGKKVYYRMCIWQEETASRSRVSAGSDCVSGDFCV